jgi:hypothetical protein
MSSVLARLLVSVYLLLIFLFFSGSVGPFQAILSFIPIVIPYHNKCLNCNRSYFKFVPQLGMASLFGNNININKYLIGILPSMLTITLLINYYPYTGLGRIIDIPVILTINSMIIIVALLLSRNFKFATKSLIWIALFLLTIFISIFLYSQEDGSSVLQQILEKINN